MRAILLGRTLDAFLTTITLGLGAHFPPRLAFLVGGNELRSGDVVGGLCALAVLDKDNWTEFLVCQFVFSYGVFIHFCWLTQSD